MTNATNLAFFLLEKTNSVCGVWKGKMTAANQRALFGKFFGKGTIIIDGEDETVEHYVKVCFGHDYNTTHLVKWNNL